MSFVVPMYESERGWGAKIDGYTGPFDTAQEADAFVDAYNKKHNSEERVPDYYIKALEPVPHRNQQCAYKGALDWWQSQSPNPS